MDTLLSRGLGTSWEVVQATRRNHAWEHATIGLLLQRGQVRGGVAGRATANGFSVFGRVTQRDVELAAVDSLARLQQGEAELAISPFCGTNLVVTGLLAGAATVAAIGGRNPWVRLPNALLAALLAVMAGQPLGRWVQKYLTTHADLSRYRLVRVTSRTWGPWTVHKVETARG